jgi:hypothetical protein
MKSEIYNALASLNRAFDVTLESLKVLHEQGVISEEYASDQSIFVQELWASINFMVVHKLNARETEDREHYGKMRETVEARLRGKDRPLTQEPTRAADKERTISA